MSSLVLYKQAAYFSVLVMHIQHRQPNNTTLQKKGKNHSVVFDSGQLHQYICKKDTNEHVNSKSLGVTFRNTVISNTLPPIQRKQVTTTEMPNESWIQAMKVFKGSRCLFQSIFALWKILERGSQIIENVYMNSWDTLWNILCHRD